MEDLSEVRRTFYAALKINQSLTQFIVDGKNIRIFEKEEEYLKECLLENGRITSMQVPWEFEELDSILKRNARKVAEKRFKRTKLATVEEEVPESERSVERIEEIEVSGFLCESGNDMQIM